MRYGFINNFSQTLAAELAAGATTLTLSGGGEAFADASPDYRYKLTLVQRDAFGAEIHREIVDVTGRSGNTLTVARQQEGTTQLSPWPSGTATEARVTAGQLAGFAPEVIAFGPVDFSDATSSATWQAPAGRKLYVDSVDVVPRADGIGAEWAAISGTPSLPGRGQAMSYNHDQTLLAVAHWSSPGVTVMATADWSVVTGTPNLGGSAYGVAFSNSGAFMAVIYHATPYLKVFNTADWTEVAGTPVMGGKVYGGLAFSPDDAYLAVGNRFANGTTIISTTGWTIAQTLAPANGDCRGLSWSANGAMLASVHDESGFQVFNTSTWAVIHSQAVPAFVYYPAFSPDGSTLAIGYDGGDNQLHLFDTSTWAETVPSLPFTSSGTGVALWSGVGDKLYISHSEGFDDFVSVVNVSGWSLNSRFPLSSFGITLSLNTGESVLAAGLSSAPNFVAASYTEYAAATINIGTTAGSPGVVLSAAAVGTFTQDQRKTLSANHATGLVSLYAEPGTASPAGALADIVVRGYTLEG